MAWTCRTRRRFSFALAGLIAAVGPATGWVGAKADTTTTGAGSVSGTATLWQFPCTNCGSGLFSGTVVLSLSGVGTSTISGLQLPYTAYWAGQLNNTSATFNFDETCVAGQPANLPPLVGTAAGSFTVSGGEAVIAGQTYGGVTLSGGLDWTRIGVTAHLTLSGLTIAASNGSTVAVNLMGTVLGQGAAAFVWTNGPGTCAVTQANQTAQIAGFAMQPV